MAKERRNHFENTAIMRDDFSNWKSKHIIMKNNKVMVYTEKNKWMDQHKEFYVPVCIHGCRSRCI